MCTVFDWFCLITCSWLQSSSIIKLWYLDVMSWDSCTLQCIHLGEGRQQDTRYGSSNDCSTAGVTTQRVINFCLSLYYNWGGRVKAGSKQVSSKQNEMVGSFCDSTLHRMWKGMSPSSLSATSLYRQYLQGDGLYPLNCWGRKRLQLQINAKTNSFILLIYLD